LFRKVGQMSLKDLMEDSNTGIALQGAWEYYKKRTKRPEPIRNRSEFIYEKAELGKFAAALKGRTNAPIPDWWGERITDVSAGDLGHSFNSDLIAVGVK